jgi:MYXO-CTERM domain-containing protein
MSRRLLVPLVAAFTVASFSPAAAGAAGPGDIALYGVTATEGVTTAKSPYRFVTVYARRGTVTTRIAKAGGRVVGSLVSPRGYLVPAVADDGSGTGLSADGRTLVLTRPRAAFPQRITRFAVVDARRMRVNRYLTLRGDFNLDAISPDGGTLYLIEHKSKRNPLNYAVRAYDVLAQTLYPKPIVDPREPDEAMRGYAVRRAMSADGRWAYTLYRGGEHPFIHALDTVGRTARCIDLPEATTLSEDPGALDLRLARGGRRLTVIDAGDAVINVDTRTFVARVAPVIPYKPPVQDGDEDGGPSAAAMGGTGFGVLVLAAAAMLAVRRRRRA